jgi:tetratricopeptide (TPR) repeat protein/ubiquinone/menaquinone biosynthesis C-methylase UbiE
MPIDSEQIFAQALALHQRGQLARAESLYRQILAASPQHLDALNLLGLAALQAGRTEEAIALIARAIGLNDRVADFHNNIAEAYRRAGRLDAAVEHFAKAAELEPTFLEAHQNLAQTLRSQGEWERAAAYYRRVVAIKPAFAEAHNDLGIALKEQGQVEEAVAAFERAAALKPDFAEAHNNLGNAWRALDRHEPAVAQFRRALALKPDLADALRNLAAVLVEQGHFREALDAARRAIEVTDGADDKLLFVHCAQTATAATDDRELRATLLRAWSELWGRPSALAGLTVSVIKRGVGVGAAVARAVQAWPRRPAAEELWGPTGLAAPSGDRLFRYLLESALVGDLELERLLTATRRVVLDAAAVSATNDAADDVLAFCCALARQCFINEYVFACDEDELERAGHLRDSLAAALESGARVPSLWPVAVAAYWPLHGFPMADALLQRPWPEPVAGLLAQQITEPREEARCRGEIARLTTVADDVSRQVRQQYEENPYPRWVDVGRVVQPGTFDTWLRARFPGMSFDHKDGADILIAGCGTGQQAIELAQILPAARVLAVDLSLSSLAYAQRKTRALALRNIEYAHADILRLGSIGRTFDLVVATGVLHHLADPLAGWRVLLKLLRQHGLMHLGLYSETGRQHIVAARDFIARHSYRSTAQDIRRCRQDLAMLEKQRDLADVTTLWDFFSTSTCRDLLFHVQEHRMTLPGIAAFLAAEGLALVRLEVESPVAVRYYRKRFPEDAAMTNLAHWHAFEREHPHTFAGMYTFWVRRRDG